MSVDTCVAVKGPSYHGPKKGDGAVPTRCILHDRDAPDVVATVRGGASVMTHDIDLVE